MKSFPYNIVAAKGGVSSLSVGKASFKTVLASAICAAIWSAGVSAQDTTSNTTDDAIETVTVVGMRANRVSSGATKLPLDIKETPQSITVLSQESLADFNLTGSNEALSLATGINVDQYETNRATFNSRGFEIQLTQIDGLGMTNDYGTVVGELDTYLFEKIELIRGANGLLTGVGNASGTINYVRKRPLNEDSGEVVFGLGTDNFYRAAVDYNKVFTEDGSWAGRFVAAYKDEESYLRDLENRDSTVYGVIDGQIGDNGVLTMGLTVRDDAQDSPMWGSLTLLYGDGRSAEFNSSSSTSQEWTYWNTQSQSAFIEYAHQLNADWEAKITYNIRRSEEDTRLLYAYSNVTGVLNDDNTGLVGWPYASHSKQDNELLDANLSGSFDALGQNHELILGVSRSEQELDTDVYGFDDIYLLQALPAFPYGSDVYPEPEWGSREPNSGGEQTLTRAYAAGRFSVTDSLKFIAGVNAVKLERSGSSRYGATVTQTEYPDTEETSPYFGVTYDINDDLTGYVSYSEIFQNQDQTDFFGVYLDPMKGVNQEVGVKAEFLDDRVLATLAWFSAEQEGLATYAGLNASGQYWYAPQDVESEGYELEVVGAVSDSTNVAFSYTDLELTDEADNDTYIWIPRETAKLRLDTRLPMLPQLKLGMNTRWQSDTEGSWAVQDSYFLTDIFVAYDLTDAASVRVNVNNIFNEKYVKGLAYGAIYGEPLNGSVTFTYDF